MRREEFLQGLYKSLRGFSQSEADDAVRYYEEYLDEIGPDREEEAIEKWGSPSKIASQIKAEAAVRDMETVQSAKKMFSAMWLVLLAVFASPIAIPLAIAAICIAIALIITAVAVILSLIVVAVSIAISGIALILVAIMLMIKDFSSMVFYFGMGIFLLAGGAAFGILIIQLSKKLYRYLMQLIRKVMPRREAA